MSKQYTAERPSLKRSWQYDDFVEADDGGFQRTADDDSEWGDGCGGGDGGSQDCWESYPEAVQSGKGQREATAESNSTFQCLSPSDDASSSPPSSHASPAQLASSASLSPSSESSIQELMMKEAEVFHLRNEWVTPTPDDALLFLHRFGWDTGAINAYLSSKDGITSLSASTSSSSSSRGGEMVCVCYQDIGDEHPLPDHFPMKCGHNLFGRECWQQYFHSKICSETPEVLPCMSAGCREPVPLSFVRDLPCGCASSSYSLYLGAFVRAYCAAKRLLQCTNRTCSMYVRIQGDAEARCSACGTTFCGRCRTVGREYPEHSPLPCPQRWEWGRIESSLAEDATMTLIKSMGRACPFCSNIQIKEPGTCNHVVCGRDTHGSGPVKGCGKEWCWYCRRPWAQCNYRCSAEKIAAAAEDFVKAEERTKFFKFFDLYNDHRAWIESHSKRLIENACQQAPHPSLRHASYASCLEIRLFLVECYQVEVVCRRQLMNAYILSYFLENSSCTQAVTSNFHDAQSRLQGAVDALQRMNRNMLTTHYPDHLRALHLSREWGNALRQRLSDSFAPDDFKPPLQEQQPVPDTDAEDPFQMLLDHGIPENTALYLLEAASYEIEIALDLWATMN